MKKSNFSQKIGKLFLYLILPFILGFFIKQTCKAQGVKRPKVVIGIAVDQMRWDYLYKFNHLYSKNGFKRLLSQGHSCQNTLVNYLPSHTAPGHTAIYTGSVPSVTGIAGNAFIENSDGLLHDAAEDKSVDLIGSSKKGSSSPKNMLVTTMGDELRLATNFKSRTFSIALKDRGSVFPGGHLANAAYWYEDNTGTFTTSTYYMKELPKWLVDFNNLGIDDSMVKNGWHLGDYDYSLSTKDLTHYEENFPQEEEPVFPHMFKGQNAKERNASFTMTPYGNTYTVMMAKACIEGEKIGMGDYTDFLSISFSSTDLLGHQFGPNSVEMQDMLIKLDLDIADFLSYLDKTYGKNNYLLFLTADHGGSHNQGFLKDLNVPAGVLSKKTMSELNGHLKKKFGTDSLVIGLTNYYNIFLNNKLLEKSDLSRSSIRQEIIQWFNEKPEVLYAIDLYDINGSNLPTKIKEMVLNGYNRRRGGDVQIILNPAWYEYSGKSKGNTHGTWSPVDTHIPLIFFGWNVRKGESTEEVYITDIAPTISSMLHIQMPNGCIGKPIQGVRK